MTSGVKRNPEPSVPAEAQKTHSNRRKEKMMGEKAIHGVCKKKYRVGKYGQ